MSEKNLPVTVAQLKTELEKFPTKEELKTELKKFPTKEELKTELKKFPTKEELKTELEKFPTKEELKTELEKFPTKEELKTELRTELKNFVTSHEFKTQIARIDKALQNQALKLLEHDHQFDLIRSEMREYKSEILNHFDGTIKELRETINTVAVDRMGFERHDDTLRNHESRIQALEKSA